MMSCCLPALHAITLRQIKVVKGMLLLLFLRLCMTDQLLFHLYWIERQYWMFIKTRHIQTRKLGFY